MRNAQYDHATHIIARKSVDNITNLSTAMDTKMYLSGATAGSLKVVASRACRKASCTELPKHATSPVLCISTPRVGSAPRSRVKEKIGAFTAT